jgi:hypothetical protein
MCERDAVVDAGRSRAVGLYRQACRAGNAFGCVQLKRLGEPPWRSRRAGWHVQGGPGRSGRLSRDRPSVCRDTREVERSGRKPRSCWWHGAWRRELGWCDGWGMRRKTLASCSGKGRGKRRQRAVAEVAVRAGCGDGWDGRSERWRGRAFPRGSGANVCPARQRAGGAEASGPRLPGAIALRRRQSEANAFARRRGTVGSSQRWLLRLTVCRQGRVASSGRP